MARALRCDVCGKDTEAIVGKLFYGPLVKGSARAVHSNYTHHCDVGVCCADRLLKSFKFRKRMNAKAYQSSRRNGK